MSEIAKEVGVTSEGNGNGSGPLARSVDDVVGDALSELYDREARLEAFAEELSRVRAAIKTLEKALGERRQERSPRSRRSTTRKSEGNTALRQHILEVLKGSLNPLSPGEIVERLGSGHPAGIASSLRFMAADGLVAKVGGAWGLPDRSDELAESIIESGVDEPVAA